MQQIGTQIGLFSGQSHAANFKRGAVITVASGSVRVISRVWLEHSSLTTQTPVQRGGVFQVRCSGWLEITADTEAVIGLTKKPGGLMSIKRLWRVATRFHEHFQPIATVFSSQEATNQIATNHFALRQNFSGKLLLQQPQEAYPHEA